MATEVSDDEPIKDIDDTVKVDKPPIEINGTNDLICAPCFQKGDDNGAVAICKECKYYLCSQCVHQHRSVEQFMFHKIAFFYCAQTLKVNRLVRANSFCLDCGYYLCQKCKLNHGGFREYRHHTFLGGKATTTHEFHDHSLLPKRKALQSRSSRKSGQSIFTQREFGGKSPYVSNSNIVERVEPKRRTVRVEERIVERPRKLLYSNVGRANNGVGQLKAVGTDVKQLEEERRVHYEEDHRAHPAEVIGEYNLQGPDDKRPCKIISSLFVGNDQLVVSDQGNKNIKLYDKDFQYQSTMQIEKFPVALCKSKNRESELFASSGNRIYLLGAINVLTLLREIQTSAPRIEGLATWDTGVAIVFKSTKSRNDRKGHLEIHLLNYEGESQYEVVLSSQYVVQLDTPVWYIAMTKDDRYMLLSDTHNNRIVCIDTTNWHVVYVLRGRTSGGTPKSLSIDQDGNILVTWYGEVRKISPLGRDLGVYVTNIAERATITYNEHTKHVAIPSWTRMKPNRFRIYQLRV